MSYNNKIKIPSFYQRVMSVWYRHMKVYSASFFSNAFPPFFEPLIFLAGLGIGISGYVKDVNGIDYTLFLATGLIVTSSMYTAAFECTFGTFIRLEFDKVYDGMLGSPVSVKDLVFGEVLFAGTKGAFFALAVTIVIWAFGILKEPLSILAVAAGFLTGILFAVLSMYITSFVKNINHFNFYLTGIISPMFFFSGVVFPEQNLPLYMRYFAEVLPLTHLVRIARAFCIPQLLKINLLIDFIYILIFIITFLILTEKGIKKRLIN